jgi:hypothetical protein
MNENEFENGEKKHGKVIIEDKRFGRDEAQAEKPAKPEAEPAAKKETAHAHAHPHKPAAEAQPEAGQEAVNLFDIGIEGFLEYNMGMVYQFAVVYLGLVANPTSGLITRDLERAKLCIDAFEFISGKLHDYLPPEAHEEISRVTKDLKLNFIQIAASPAPPMAAAPAPAAKPEPSKIITPDSPKK